MSPVLSAIATVIAGTGIWLTVAGLRRRPVSVRPGNGRLRVSRAMHVAGLAPGGILHRRRHLVMAGAATGFVVAIVTGWYVLIIVIPAAAVGLPALFRRTTSSSEAELLTDLTAWVRSLVGVLSGGAVGLEQAIRATMHGAPVRIRPSVVRLIARLDARQPLAPALRRWADEINDYSADLVAAALILESDNRTGAVCPALRQLADSLAAQAKARLDIETERSSGRATVRWVTVVTIAVLLGTATTGYLDGYNSPTGQLVALVLFAAYVGCLVWMRSISIGRPRPRFLPADAGFASHRARRRGPDAEQQTANAGPRTNDKPTNETPGMNAGPRTKAEVP